MTNEGLPWMKDIDPTRSNPGDYVLNGKDRMYCITGEGQGTLKRSKLKSRIAEDRLKAFPQRIQDLLDDIGLISYAEVDFLSDTERDELWEAILNTDSRVSATLDFRISSARPRTSEFELGLGLGAAIRKLQSGTGFHTDELIWGFTLGLRSYPRQMYEREEEQLDKLLASLHEKKETRIELLEKEKRRKEATKEAYDTEYQFLRHYLENKGIDIDTFPIRVDKLTMHLDLPSFSSEMTGIEEILDETLDFDQISRLTVLKDAVEKDIDDGLNQEWRGEQGDLILQELWMKSKINDESDAVPVANLTSIASSNTGMKLINDYSGEGKNSITKYPLIDQANHGCRLTAYGKLVAYSYFNKNGNCNWILKHNIFDVENSEQPSFAQLSGQKQSLLDDVESEIDMEKLMN